jgi:phosphatidylserine decarboxylase
MRVPFTRFGLPQLIVYPLVTLILMALLFFFFFPALWLFPAEVVLSGVFLWMLSFFRDPARKITCDETVLLSPADGTVTDISPSDDCALGVKALRIGIFLSVFNVHINRAPCSVRVEKTSYKKGAFKSALSPESGKINESNDILMVRLSQPKEKLLVRQISGAIARRIVCEAKEAGEYRQGEAFGMIKFGSRTELYLPAFEEGRFEVAVKPGDRVAAGITPLVRYKT